MATVHDVAAYILKQHGPMTAMKLQKLQDRIEAWANGPVVPRVLQQPPASRIDRLVAVGKPKIPTFGAQPPGRGPRLHAPPDQFERSRPAWRMALMEVGSATGTSSSCSGGIPSMRSVRPCSSTPDDCPRQAGRSGGEGTTSTWPWIGIRRRT